MLLRLITPRADSPREQRYAFRWRGEGVSRIEGLSDTVFGFAITLLVVSLEVPHTATDLFRDAVGFIPFVASFLVLFFLWRSQFEFFRRFALEDETTLWLTGLLLVCVLFLIYPLKFLFTVFADAVIAGGVAKERLRFEQFPAVLGLYAIGLTGIALAFALLYQHAYRERDRLEMSPLEAFDTLTHRRRWVRVALTTGTLELWCVALLALGPHLRARDGVFTAVFRGGWLVVAAVALLQRLRARSALSERAALLADSARVRVSTSAAE